MRKELSESKIKLLRDGTVIPAHPLALDGNRKLNEKHQRALTRYYIDAGAGGVAVGVHSTQFEIRNPEFNLYEPVLRLAAEEVNHAVLRRPFLKIAGVCGPVDQAVKETSTAARLGYDMVLLSMGGLDSLSEEQLLANIEANFWKPEYRAYKRSTM